MNATASEISMPMLALIGIGLMYGPIRPETKAIGRSAAITVKVARIVGPPTSSTALGMISAEVALPEYARWRWMFSTTTMASSTRMPIEKMSANSDTRFSVKPQAQEANSVAASVTITAAPTTSGLAAAQREQHQHDHRGGREEQLLDQLLRLVVGGLAVVARDGDVHAVGHIATAQLLHALDDLARHGNRIGTRLLRHRDGDGGRMGGRRQAARCGARAGAEPHIGIRLIGPGRYVGHVFQEHRPALAHGDYQPRDIVTIRQKLPGIHRRHAIPTHEAAGVLRQTSRE